MLKFAGARQIDYYYLKEGFFSKKELSICHSCTIYLDKKYGEKKWYVFKNKILTGPIENDIIDIKKFREEIDRIRKEEYEKKFGFNKTRKKNTPQKTLDIQKEINQLKKKIIKLLKEKSMKMPASDIDAHLKRQIVYGVPEIKKLCEEMYFNGEIGRTGNYRYFIPTEEKKDSAPKSEEVDVEKELEKLKGLLSKGLITQEQYDAKSNKLLGL
tara:strand:+ start:125 stop:763 length:639 start_codon:yes stop_codon:yes gene_type:complete